jgi:protein-S-isoprenylcysteine O-methyltransferase Ste14
VSFPKPYADAVARLRVLFGFVMVAAFLWFSAPDGVSLAVGLPVAASGLALRAWAAGHLEKNVALAQSGPYARVRNPLYLGTLTAAAGLAIAARRWELAALFAAVFGLVYLPVVELEEQHLRELFPEFADYARRVPRLIPRLVNLSPSVARSGDAARRSACATSLPKHVCEKCGPLPDGRGSASGRRFRWEVYRRNREYEALAGFLAGVAALAWKALSRA